MADSDCVGHFINDGKKQDQAVAICSNNPKAHQAQKIAQITNHGRILSAQFTGQSLNKFFNSKKKQNLFLPLR